MIQRIALAAVLAVALAGPALAGSCPKHVAAIDKALQGNHGLSAAELTQVKALRDEGEQQHRSGQHGASLETLAKAEAILGISM